MKKLSATQKLISAWLILSISLVAYAFKASPLEIIGLTANLTTAFNCFDVFVIGKSRKEE